MISIIIPVYNTAGYLDKCIASVVDQAFSDIEILLIDDCSTDGSSDILDRWAEKDPRIFVFHKKENSGVSDSRNMGLRMAHGDFIGFVDSDDWIEPEMYYELYRWIENTGADIAFGGYNRIMADGTASRTPPLESGSVVSTDEALEHCIPQRGAGRYDLFTVDKLYRRSSITKNGELILFDKNFCYGEDVLWLIQVILNSQKIVYWKGCGYNYLTDRQGNTWSDLNRFNDMVKCKSAMDTNREIYRLLLDADIGPINNAFQRLLYYRRFAFRTAVNLHDLTAYKEYHSGYYRDLLRWYTKNKSLIGLRWMIRQFGADFVFQAKRLLSKT